MEEDDDDNTEPYLIVGETSTTSTVITPTISIDMGFNFKPDLIICIDRSKACDCNKSEHQCIHLESKPPGAC